MHCALSSLGHSPTRPPPPERQPLHSMSSAPLVTPRAYHEQSQMKTLRLSLPKVEAEGGKGEKGKRKGGVGGQGSAAGALGHAGVGKPAVAH